MITITKCMHHIFIFEWLNVIIIPNGRLIICWSSWNIGTIWNFAGGHALDRAWSDAFSVCYKWDGIFTWVWYSTEIADWEWNKWVSKSHRQRFLGGILCYLGIFYFRHISLYISLESRGGKKNPNPLVHPNPPTNCPPKPTYLINGQMGASPIRPN